MRQSYQSKKKIRNHRTNYLPELIEMIREIKPEFVTIGADSKGHKLVEPPWKKVQALIDNLSTFTE